MIDPILALSTLATSAILPAGIRRASAAVQAAERNSTIPEDSFEYGPHHTHGEGEICPYCQAASVEGETDAAPTSERQPAGEAKRADETPSATSTGDPEEQARVEKLKQTDQKVRSHEAAHQAAGGSYAGSASFKYKRGPDGKQYAVAGEVPIDLSQEDSPAATIAKMQQVRRAALAPADPSGADRQVAAKAAQIEREARAQLAQESKGGNLDVAA